MKWLEVCKELSSEWRTLNSFGDPWNWWLFDGTVKPEYIVAVNTNPSAAILNETTIGSDWLNLAGGCKGRSEA